MGRPFLVRSHLLYTFLRGLRVSTTLRMQALTKTTCCRILELCLLNTRILKLVQQSEFWRGSSVFARSGVGSSPGAWHSASFLSALPLFPLASFSLGILKRKSSIRVAGLFDFSLYNYPFVFKSVQQPIHKYIQLPPYASFYAIEDCSRNIRRVRSLALLERPAPNTISLTWILHTLSPQLSHSIKTSHPTQNRAYHPSS